MAHTLDRLGFAALKGTRHVARETVRLDADGPVGDREWCLVEQETRRVLRTAARPLMHVTVTADGDHLHVATGDGHAVEGRVTVAGEPMLVDYWRRPATITPYAGAPASFLAELVDRPVLLGRARRGDVVYGAPVSLVGAASLADLAERLGRPELAGESERFRSTFLVRTDEPWIEDTWLGLEVVLGEATIRINEPIGRCAVPNHNPLSGLSDASTLKALAGFRPRNHRGEPLLGVDAHVVTPGTVRVGDPVQLVLTADGAR
ncbi:hypothetical protein BJ980_000528 [Nocardioides daedukensis]|uniref:MOSC domain-containing protein n=1 Tax=Nocardioides daedukensis TaxID=634462 RepID=A0A7Y9S165_9ACTN|nr:MOSC domain-containing protein [Nocardioides daedukensis]NYG57605.1 hypothetical protein [Nocardioides daedukensis]